MGHKWIDETMFYVHIAEAHHREPENPATSRELASS